MKFIITFIVMLGFTSLALGITTPSTNKNNPVEGLHLDWLDTAISPANDFYAYANGTWQKRNPIPPEYPSWGSFNILQEKTEDIIHQILIAASNDKNASPGSIEQKVGDFYYSGMNEDAINKLGIKPLQPEFARIDAIKNLADLQQVIAQLQLIGVDALFTFGSMQDFKNSEDMIGAAHARRAWFT